MSMDAKTAETKAPEQFRPGMGGLVRMLLWDCGLAVAAYYLVRALGFGPYYALLAGTVVAGLRVVYVALRTRRVDAFAGFLLAVFGVGLVLSFVTGDARFLLVKDSIGTGVAGLIFLGTCLAGRPLTFHAAKRAMSGGGAEREAMWDRRWRDEPAFRRTFVVLAVGWGLGLLAEAAVRIPLIYLLSIDVMAGLSQVLQIVAYGLLIVWTIAYVRRAQRR